MWTERSMVAAMVDKLSFLPLPVELCRGLSKARRWCGHGWLWPRSGDKGRAVAPLARGGEGEERRKGVRQLWMGNGEEQWLRL